MAEQANAVTTSAQGLARYAFWIVFLGVVLRIAVSLMGWNQDYEAWKIIRDIALSGDNVYAVTHRYNYGPVWFLFIKAFGRLTHGLAHNETAFRLCIVLLLTGVDVCIFGLLRKGWGLGPAALFLLHPVSIIITGYHNQFDNMAIALGLAAVLLYEQDVGDASMRRKACAMLLLGLSLATKHLLFLYPLWLALRPGRMRDRALVLLVPVGIFLLSFAPFWAHGSEGIMRNVFGYSSHANAPLWSFLGVTSWVDVSSLSHVWMAILAVSGVAFRKLRPRDGFLLYTLVMVAFSPSMANQYLAIIVPAAAVFWNPLFALWSLLGLAFLMGNEFGLSLPLVRENLPWLASRGMYVPLIGLMLLGLALVVARKQWRRHASTPT